MNDSLPSDQRCPSCGGLAALHPVEGQCVDRPSKNQLMEIAWTIGRQPVLGHWPHMRAQPDMEVLQKTADEIERLRAALETYGRHRENCVGAYVTGSNLYQAQCNCGLQQILHPRGADETVATTTGSRTCAHPVGNYTCPSCGMKVTTGETSE